MKDVFSESVPNLCWVVIFLASHFLLFWGGLFPAFILIRHEVKFKDLVKVLAVEAKTVTKVETLKKILSALAFFFMLWIPAIYSCFKRSTPLNTIIKVTYRINHVTECVYWNSIMHLRNILFIEFTTICLCSVKSKLKQGDRVWSCVTLRLLSFKQPLLRLCHWGHGNTSTKFLTWIPVYSCRRFSFSWRNVIGPRRPLLHCKIRLEPLLIIDQL